MHPNVVPMRGKLPPLYYKATLMVAAIVFPEIMMCMAIAQWWKAREVHKKWCETWEKEPGHTKEIAKWLGMAGAYFVVMGGYTVHRTREVANQGESKAPEDRSRPTHTPSTESEKDEREVTTITAAGFMKLLESDDFKNRVSKGVLNQSHFDHVIIEDKGKSSTLAKVIVVFQVLWMVVQIGGRKQAGLPVTLLEASIAVQIPYSIISFFFWWDKPLDVGEPIAIPVDEVSLHHDAEEHSPEAFLITEGKKNKAFLHMALRAAYDVVFYFSPRFEIASAVTAIINGGLHAAMWNAYFPTPIEQLLWRMSCVGMGLFPVIYFFLVCRQGFENEVQKATFDIRREAGGIISQHIAIFKSVWEFCKRFVYLKNPKWYSVCGRIVHVILLGLCVNAYIMCILYMTVESFVSLRELPAGAYTLVRWSSVIPHF